MPHFEIARAAFADCYRSRRLWLIQFIANPILFGLFAAWLLIPVASSLHLIWNFLFALFLLAAVLVLHAGTLNWFFDHGHREAFPLWPAFRRAARHLFSIAVCVACLYFLWLLVDKLETLSNSLPAYIRSTFSVFLRHYITLGALDELFSVALFFSRWILAPGLLLPLFLQAADRGFRDFGLRGLAAWRKAILNPLYWLLITSSALLGVFATQVLMDWTPDFRISTFHSEGFSLAWRLLASYLLGLFSWLLVCSMVGRCAVAAGVSSGLSGNSAS